MKTLIAKKYLAIFFIPLILLMVFVLYISISQGKHYSKNIATVSLREFPYPYKAALAISNDIDETHTLKEFLTINEFLTTKNQTAVGTGLGLEIGSSFYAKNNEGRFALISDNPNDQQVILDLIHLGYMDFIHSYNKIKDRTEIIPIIDFLKQNNCSIKTWVNHGKAANNMGSNTGFFGDDTNHVEYHADLTLDKLGCIFFWNQQVSGIIGQERAISFLSFFDAFDFKNPFSTFSNYTLSESIKYLFSVFGSQEYKHRRYNELVNVTYLDDGQAIFEFQRSNFCAYGVWGDCATMDGFADSMREKVVRSLVANKGYSIVFTHFGKNDGFPYISEKTKKVLTLLADENSKGNIYITTSTKLLSYFVNRKYLHWNYKIENDSTRIFIESVSDPVRGSFIPGVQDLQGLTFYTDKPQNTKIFIGDSLVKDIQINVPDNSNRKSIMINLSYLSAPDSLYRKYKKMNFY